MPEEVDNCVKSILDDDPEMDKSRAHAICNAMQNRGELEHVKDADKIEAQEDPCESGYTMVGTKTQDGQEVPRCVPSEDVPDAEMAYAAESDCPDGKVEVDGDCVPVEDTGKLEPPTIANSAHIMASDGLETEPIERIEESDGEVRYANLQLLTEGVWTDQASKTPTLYPEEGINNIEAEYPGKQAGPPVNIMHDVNTATGETHEPSHAGYVDPNSLAYHGGGLTGDIVLTTTDSAGEYADDNLKSALESDGRVGFGGPSVELDLEPGKHLQESDHPRAETEITGGYLTGLGLVMDPADDNVAFAKQTQDRAVAMASSQESKHLRRQRTLMDVDKIRNTLDNFGLDIGDSSDEEVVEMAEDLHDQLMDELQAESELAEDGGEEDEEDANMEGDEEDEEDEESEMGADQLQEEMSELRARLEEMEDEMAQLKEHSAAMSDLEDVQEELAAAETVAELEDAKDELDKRLSNLEDEPETKTLAEDGVDESAYVGASTPVRDSPNSL